MDATIWLSGGHPLSRGFAAGGKTDTTEPCGVCGAKAGAACVMTERDRMHAEVTRCHAEWRADLKRAVVAVAALRREPACLPAPSSEWDSAIDAALEAIGREFPHLSDDDGGAGDGGKDGAP
jgi:hypothetical protein